MADNLQNLRRNFFAGLFVTLPVLLSVWLLVWLFGLATNATSILLEVLPKEAQEVFQHQGAPTLLGRLLTLTLVVLAFVLVGSLTRRAMGKDLMGYTEKLIAKTPLLSKIYPTIKEIISAFQPGRKSAFREAVLVEFPDPGTYAIAFVTGEVAADTMAKEGDPLVTVFVPTTPNPTSGFLLLLPRKKITPLKISVADAIKLVISGGSVASTTEAKNEANKV